MSSVVKRNSSARRVPQNDGIIVKAWPGCSAQMIADDSGSVARAIGIAVKHYPDTCRAVQNAEADRDPARRALQQLLDALDKVENAQSSLNQLIEDL